MMLSHRVQLDPTEAQKTYFVQATGTARFVWNWALAEWDEQYAMGGRPTGNELLRYFNSVKYHKFPWLRDMPANAHSRPFADLSTAWSRHLGNRKTVGRPQFKKKGKARDSFYVDNQKMTIGVSAVRLPRLGWVRMTEELRFAGKIMSATVLRIADRWFISIRVEMPEPTPVQPAGAPIGVDVGLTAFATLSTGEKIESPRPLKKALRRLRRLGRWHSRKKLKSQNRRKSQMRLARQHARIANVRSDFLHKLTTRLAKEHREVCVEDLNVRGMLKNHKLALHIADAGWGEFRRQLEYKTKLYGSKLTVRERFFASSKTCSVCGEKINSLPLSVRTWTCSACGTVHDRDVNAAINLVSPTTVGSTGSYACGDCGAGPWLLAKDETAVSEAGTTKGLAYAFTT